MSPKDREGHEYRKSGIITAKDSEGKDQKYYTRLESFSREGKRLSDLSGRQYVKARKAARRAMKESVRKAKEELAALEAARGLEVKPNA